MKQRRQFPQYRQSPQNPKYAQSLYKSQSAIVGLAVFLFCAAQLVVVPAFGSDKGQQDGLDVADWSAVLAEAEGQRVYFHAWGGDPQINSYIDWTASRVAEDFGITLKHVKSADIADVVAQLIAEEMTGDEGGGSVDLLWVNGENFAILKESNALQQEGWATQLPHWGLVDVAGKPTVVTDFTVPTDGLESPWGMAQLVFIYDSAITSSPPKSAAQLLQWAAQNQGRFTYPAPPDFFGSTFIKQVLLELLPDHEPLSKPVSRDAFADATALLFAYLDQLHPHLWRQGEVFPVSGTQLLTLMADSETDLAFAFNPAAASNAIARGDLPTSVRSYIFDKGTIGNSHFVAIPRKTSAKAAALVVADFLLSPEAQAHKQDPNVWGDPTVLDVGRLSEDDRALFTALDLGIATLSPSELTPTLAEPHPTWMRALEAAWYQRYGVR